MQYSEILRQRLCELKSCIMTNSPSRTQECWQGSQLRLVFATHDISLRGRSLRRLETVKQGMELSFLTTLPGKQRSLVPDGQPVFTEIAVTEIAPPGIQAEEGPK